jgi:flagellin-specific chaperone FliS
MAMRKIKNRVTGLLAHMKNQISAAELTNAPKDFDELRKILADLKDEINQAEAADFAPPITMAKHYGAKRLIKTI